MWKYVSQIDLPLPYNNPPNSYNPRFYFSFMNRKSTYSIEQIKEVLGDPSGHIGEWLETEKGSARIRIERSAPFVGVAAHAGSSVRPELLERMAVSETQRFFEEDPHTERFAELLPIAIIVSDSRFEYDLNRPQERAVYTKPEDAWGLDVWKERPPDDAIARSIEKHDEFHDLMDAIAEHLIAAYGWGVIFDFHAFNRRCASCGPSTATDWLAEEKPEIDICTARIDRERWTKEIKLWKESLGDIKVNGVNLRIGENAVFNGGYLVNRIAESFGEKILHLVTEIKKIYMDETRGELFPDVLNELVLGMGKAVERLTSIFQEDSS